MIKVQKSINASIDKVWDLWTSPEHIKNWNVPFENWHTPHVENNLKVGGKFKFTMAVKDGSDGFDFEGTYTKIEKFSWIEYRLLDNRTANVRFENNGSEVKLTETFEPETKISEKMQEQFCSAIIQKFKEYVENNKTINRMITVQNTINASIDKVWNFWTLPEHITKWSFASPDWHTPFAENDLREGGKFKSTMAAKDGSMSFDFEGEYTLVKQNKAIEYVMADGRKVEITFKETADGVEVIESFDPETLNPEEMQRGGWQAILDNFKSYTEAN